MGLSLFLSFLVPSCAKQASLSFLAQVSEDKPLSFIRICLSGDFSNNLFWGTISYVLRRAAPLPVFFQRSKEAG